MAKSSAALKVVASNPVKATSPGLSKKAKLQRMRQRWASYAIGGVGLTLTALSLSHLAEGVQVLTHSTPWHSWAMATGIDMGFIGLELGQLTIYSDKLRAKVEWFARPAIWGTLIVSALMNAYAFGHQADSWAFLCASVALGVAVPALVYVLTRVSLAMFLETQK